MPEQPSPSPGEDEAYTSPRPWPTAEELLAAEQTPAPERQVSPEELSRDMVGDFIQTFRLSQGKSDTQEYIFKMLGSEYAKRMSQPAFKEALVLVKDRVEQMSIPGQHGQVDEDTTRSEYRVMLEEMELATDKAYSQDGDSEAEQVKLAGLVAGRMVTADGVWQSKPRPNRGPRSDEHASILREYVIGGKLHGSAALLAVRDRLREAVLVARVRTNEWPLTLQLNRFIPTWEANHPGESFWE